MTRQQARATAVGAVREFGEALARSPFRIALALSVILHLGLFLGLRGIKADPPRRPPVRVHFVREAPAPPPSPPTANPRVQRAVPGSAAGPAKADVEASRPRPAQEVAPAPIPETAPAAPPASAPAPIPETVPAAPPATAPASIPAAAEPLPAPSVPPAVETPPAPQSASQAAVTSGVAPEAGGGVGPDAATASDAGPPGREDSSLTARAFFSDQVGAGERQAAAGPSAREIAALRDRIAAVARKGYPQIAVRNGWEGRVLVEMHLELDGSLAKVRLVARSDHSILDEAAMAAVRLASPFPPIARIVTVPVEYRLIP